MTDQELSQFHPSFQPMVRAAVEALEAKGYHPAIVPHTGGCRTGQQQQDIYNQGGGKTHAKGLPVCESFHCYGLAVDLFDSVLGYNVNYTEWAAILATLGLEWGDRGYPDYDHWEYRGGLSLVQVMAGQRPALLPQYANQTNEELTQEDMQKLDDYIKQTDARLNSIETVQPDSSGNTTVLVQTIKQLKTQDDRLKQVKVGNGKFKGAIQKIKNLFNN